MSKNLTVETLRIASIFWVILFHVVGGHPGAGLGYYETTPIQYLIFSVRWFPVPLFALLAGYVYGLRPLVDGSYGVFVSKKLRRIMLPALGFSLLFFSLRLFAPGVNHRPELGDLWRELLMPQTHVWFLYALFGLLVLAGALTRYGLMQRPSVLATLLLTTCLVHTDPSLTHLLCLNDLVRIAPYFLLGFALAQYPVLREGRVQVGLALLGLPLLALKQYFWFAGVPQSFPWPVWHNLALSLTLLPLVLAYTPPLRALYVFAPFTYAIYLFHPIGAAVGRLVLLRVGLVDPLLLTILCHAGSVLFSIGVAALPSLLVWTRSRVRPQAG